MGPPRAGSVVPEEYGDWSPLPQLPWIPNEPSNPRVTGDIEWPLLWTVTWDMGRGLTVLSSQRAELPPLLSSGANEGQVQRYIELPWEMWLCRLLLTTAGWPVGPLSWDLCSAVEAQKASEPRGG
jgi:hypothetical protein